MDDISYFNPLKEYSSAKDGKILMELLPRVDKEVCFVGDDAGYFFSMCRRINHPSISFSDEKFYNFFMLLKNDIYALRDVLQNYSESYTEELLEYFEERIHTEPHPYVQAFILFVLSNSSLNVNSDFSNFVNRDLFFVKNKIRSLSKYFIGNNNLYYQTIPDNCFVVSYERDMPTCEGILISKHKHNYYLITETDKHKYYYREVPGIA